MAVETFYFPIGLIGTTMHYKKISVIVPNESIKNSEIVKNNFKELRKKEIMLSPRRKFFKLHKPKKESKNYEGNGTKKK